MGVERGDSGAGPDSSPARAEQAVATDAGEREVLARPPTAQSVGFTVSSLGFAIAQRFENTLAPLGLEPREFALMRAVSVAEGQTQQAIAASLRLQASRLVALVDTLEARGLIERRHNPRDRRARELHLTADGTELLDRAFARAAGLELELCAGLTAKEREQLLELLHRLGASLGVPAGVHAASAQL